MKKVLIAFLVLLCIAGIGGTIYFYLELSGVQSEKEVLITQNGELQSAIDTIGPVTTTWTVKADVFAGKDIKADDLIEQTTPVSSVNENYIKSKEQVVGQFYKVDVSPGTTLTLDLVMKDEMPETTYERDLTFSYLPLGLEVGDYLDIRMVLPYGEEFIILSHERVYTISGNTVKLIFDEAQLALWTSALTDKAIWGGKGLAIYGTKYVEPGIHAEAIPFYPVRKEMESVVTLNPNIKNKKQCVNASLRDEIELKLNAVLDEHAGDLNSGRTTEAADINTAKETYYNNTQNNNSGNGNTNKPVVNNSDPTIQDELDNLNEGLEDVGDSVTLDQTDSDGNGSSVTNGQVEQSGGKDVFSDEDIIE